MAILTFGLVLLATVIIALLSRRGFVKNNVNDVLVASGSFGPALLFFIMVGEVYTTATLLGVPGSIYKFGATWGFWFINYILLAYAVAYFMCPALWRLGRLCNGATIGDILGWRFNSNSVQVVVGIIGIIFLIPIVQMQLAGMSIALEYLDLGISGTQAVFLAMILALGMVVLAGIRAPAYVSILKDFLLILAVVVIGTVCVMKTDGGISKIFQTVADFAPEKLVVKSNPPTAGLTNTMSTVFFQMLAMNIFPILVAGTLTSKSEKTIRRNTILMPIYMIMMPFLVIAAYFALINLPNLNNPDEAVLAIALKHLPSWVLGIIAGGITLTGTLAASVNALSIAGLFSKNVLKVINPNVSQKAQVFSVNIATGIVILIAGMMVLFMPNLLAAILAMSFNGMAQLLVAFCFAFFWKGGTKEGIFAGIAVSMIYLFIYTGSAPFGLNKGLCGLGINFVVAIVVSFLTKTPDECGRRFDLFKNTKPNRTPKADVS